MEAATYGGDGPAISAGDGHAVGAKVIDCGFCKGVRGEELAVGGEQALEALDGGGICLECGDEVVVGRRKEGGSGRRRGCARAGLRLGEGGGTEGKGGKEDG